MKRILKRTLAVLLTVVMLVGAAPMAGLTGLFIKSGAVNHAVGDIVEFGSYPQSEVTDSSTVSALNAAPQTWVSYRYMSGAGTDRLDGSAQPSDYMKYCDVTIGNTKYRGVRFSTYRCRITNGQSTTSTSITRQDENGYNINTTYWFKYEPLKLRVLDPSEGLVLCENIIDSQAYSNTISYYNNAYRNSTGAYASDYESSSIRAWLNDDFYNTAFNSSQQSKIKTTHLENKSTYSSTYDSADTDDKVFLLSYWDALNPNYGFDSSNNTARMPQGTDYAKCQGLWVSTDLSSYYGNSYWLLRTPGYYSYNAWCVNNYGNVYSYGNDVDNNDYGIRPALKITNLSSLIYQSSDDTPAPDGTTISFTKDEYTCSVGEEFPMSGELYSPNGTNGITLNWSVSDPDGVTVNTPASMQNTDANHIIFSALAKGNKEGTYTVTVTTSNGASSTREVVVGNVHAVKFDPESTSGIYQINGKLENYSVTTNTNTNTGHSYAGRVKINGKWYNVTKDILSGEKAEQLKGKDVICNFDENIKEITAISKCRELSDLNFKDLININNGKRFSVKIDNEYRWIRGKVYKDGGSSTVGSIPFQIWVYNSIPSEYFDLSDACKNNSAFDIEISEITLYGISNCGRIQLYDNSFPTIVKLGESAYFNGEIVLPADFWLGYEDSEKTISAEYEIKLKSGSKIKKAFQTVVKNRDIKMVTENENTKLADAANKLKKTPTNAILLDGLSEIGFTSDQINYLEKLVLVELSLYTMPKESLEEYVSKKVMEKIFCVKNWLGVQDGKMTIVVQTKYQGRDIQVDIVCDIQEYSLDNRTFGNFTNLTYHAYNLKNGKREKNDFKNGEAGLAVSANVEEFAKAATDLAMGEIKTASKKVLSGYEEVERMIFGDTALKILNAAGYKSFFDFGWELYVNKCKELVCQCPVDIYVYDKDDQLCGAIVNNEVTLNTSEAVDLEVKNDDKIVTLWEDGYYIKTLSNCTGTLNISVQEKGYVNGDVRTLSFENLPLEIGTIYKQGCGTDYYDDQKAYAVELLNGETIQATTDNLCLQPSAKYTVIYNANGGNVTVSSETVHEGEYVILPTATREGYRFLGWSMSNDNTSDFNAGNAFKVTADTLLFAAWEKVSTTKPAVKSVSVSDVEISYKNSTALKPNVTADEGAKYTVKYESSNPKVATVDGNGNVYGAKKGTAEIKVTVTDEYGNILKDTCKVTVKYSGLQWFIIIVLFGWIWY